MRPSGYDDVSCGSPGQARVIARVLDERDRQDKKWGTIDNFDNRSPHEWMTILTEEVGELAEAFLERDQENAIEEATHVAAVAVGILESLQRRSITERETR